MIKLFRNIRQNLLAEGKTTKYLKYAIGEILLVVIGIYLAIQFNNWNIENQNKRTLSDNIEMLIKSLEKDSIYFKEAQTYLDKDRAKLSNYEFRLSQSTANLDTLVKIVRYEYNPLIVIINFYNDDAYHALVQSGEINLLNRELKMKMFSLYSFHKSSEKTNDMHFKIYIDWFTLLNSKYASNSFSTYGEGPIGEAMWDDATLIELGNAFNPVVFSKKNHYRLMDADLKELIVDTNKVLQKLKEELKLN